jgi:sugar-specific transcriptional regulator TrmB
VATEAKLHRTHAYDILNSLIKKSIVSYVVRENRKYFQAVNPDQLSSLLNDRKEELKKSEDQLKLLIEELQKISVSSKSGLLVSVYDGKKGFKALLEDILRRRENYFVIGYNPKAEDSLKYFLPNFYKQRIKAKIHRKAIVDPQFKGGSWVEKQKMQQIRFLKYSFPMGIIIYGNRVVMTVIEENHQMAIVIESDKVAENFVKLFDSLWSQADK